MNITIPCSMLLTSIVLFLKLAFFNICINYCAEHLLLPTTKTKQK